MNKKSIAESKERLTEQRIMKAAEEEFLLKGYAGARTSSIAQAAGVTHAMLHYYFRTKESIFQRILADKLTAVKQMINATATFENMTLEERITKIIEVHLENVVRDPLLPRFFINELLANPDRLATFEESIKGPTTGIIDRLQRELDEGYRQGRLAKVDALSLMIDIMSVNILPFILSPVVARLANRKFDVEEFLMLRRKENITLIMKRLKP